jgi:hypothetical protein
MARPSFLRVPLALSLLAAAACSDTSNPTQPGTRPEPGPSQPPAPDADFSSSALARAIPGLGGFYIDANGVATVRLTDLAGRAAADRVLRPQLKALGAGPELKVIKADYTAQQLEAWFQRASPQLLALRGVVFVDNDEQQNRVTVGVESRAVGSSVRSVLRRLGIQSEAVRVEEVGPVYQAITLQDRVRPVVGGLQIHWFRGTSGFLCSLGFNALNAGDARRSFLTNSHCTRVQGSVTPPLTNYSQHLSPNAIGTEVEDPRFFTGGVCPAFRRCRRSDAARAVYNSSTSAAFRTIARTSGAGSIAIVGSWVITAESNPIVGQVLNKVGRTTGWSFGRVTRTCVTVNVSGTNITLICQDIVHANVGAGDSGSPVFRRLTSTGTDVALNGLLWGGTTIRGVTHFVMSHISLIEAELGALATF